MNATTARKPSLRRCPNYARSIAALLAAAGVLTPLARAATIYWDGSTAGWNTAANWSTDPALTTPDPAAFPGAADTATFNVSSVNGAETISLNAAEAALGLVFNNTGTTALQGGGTNQTLTLGTGGITLNAGAGTVTIGSATAGQNVAVTLGGAETWTNNSSSLLTDTNGITNGANLLTITGTGNTTLSGIVGAGAGGITKTGTGLLTLSGANTYTGLTTISAGTVRATVAGALGAGTAANALTLAGGTLQLASDTATTFGRNTTVTTSSTIVSDRATSGAGVALTLGTLSIGAQTLTISNGTNIASGSGGITFGATTLTGASIFSVSSGATLNLGAVANGGNLLTANGAGTMNVTGIISGAGGITQSGTGLLVLSGANTYTGINTISSGTIRGTVAGAFGANTSAGAITLSGGTIELLNDTGTTFTNTNTTVTANSNVTANRATSAATSTAHTLGALSIGAQTLSVTRGANITGAGIGGITFGATTMTGNATFAPGASTTLTLGAVGGAFSLTENGAGTLILNGASTYTGGTTVTNGLLQINNATGAGTGAITLSPGATTSNRILVNGGVTIANPINFGNTTGTTGLGVLQQTGAGQARFNGAINITGVPSAGGHFVGGAAVGNELVLGGVITSTVGLTQRDGRVIYIGGGTGYTSLTVTNTALVGATNGISTTANMVLGGSGTATLDLNGFDQTLAGLTLGNAGVTLNGVVTLGARTLTLNGNIAGVTGTGFTGANTITGAAGGTLNVGTTARTISLTDNLAPDDLVISNVNIAGAGGLIKGGTGAAGAGTLALTGVTIAGPLVVNNGTLATGKFNAVGSFTTGSLAFGGGTTLRMKIGTGGDLITSGALTAAGVNTVNLSQFGGALPVGIYPLINYTGTSPGVSNFTLGPLPGHSVGTLVDTGTAIAYNVTANDQIVWDGTNSTTWSTGATGNWKLFTGGAPTDYFESDDVVFQDAPTNPSVTIAANVSPSNVTFTNTAATAYNVSGTAGIIGTTGLTKSGNGILTLSNTNSYVGATNVTAGTLIADYSTGTPLGASTTLNIGSAATVKFTHTGGVFSLVTPITGTGTVIIDPSTTTAGNRDIATVTWPTTGFTGTLDLKPTTGTMRIQVDATSDVGGGQVIVDNGGQVFISAANLTFANNFTLAGTGFSETAGTLGAIRANTDTFTGTITINGSAKIGALNGTATFTNTISGGTLTFGGSINNAASETMNITGDASSLAGLIVNDASGTSSAANVVFDVGNGTATGTLGAVPVTLKGDGFKTAIIRFDRSNGYTLGATVTSASPTSVNDLRTQLQVDTLGTGFDTNGITINLGSSGSAAPGGAFRVGNTRAGSLANVNNSTITAGSVLVSAGAANATLNLNSGANVITNSLTIGAGGTGGVLNISTGANLSITSNLHLGEAANNSATVNQTGGAVTFGTQMRVGHFATETGTYNLSGGTLAFTGAVGTFPFTTGTTEQNGGIYLGIDGTGNMTHSGGTVTTGFLVLDNRTDTASGANMVSGIDTYTLSGTGTLVFSNAFGLITRNPSVAIFLNGGTIQAGAGVSPNLDTTKINVGGPVAINTNGANTFTLYGPMTGTGAFNVTGGGTFRTVDSTGATTTVVGGVGAGVSGSFGPVSVSVDAASTLQANRTGIDVWSGAVSGAGTLSKINTGSLALTGNGSGFTGAALVTSGRLDVPTNFAAGTITVSDGATLGGESTNQNVNLGITTGSNLFINGASSGALTTTNLSLAGTTTVDFSVAPASTANPITVLNYTNLTGTPNFVLANAASYRPGATFNTGGAGTVTLSLVTKALTWTGNGGLTWNVNSTQSWNDPTPAPDVFFAGDTVTFDDTSANTAVAIASGVAPFKTTVSSSTSNYTLTSAGSGIAGSGNLEKSGASTLTLVGTNTYSGQTIVSGGTLIYPSPTSLGNASASNSIALSGGAKLTDNGAASFDLGINRSLVVGTGGAILSHSNATAATITISGNVTGGDNLQFNSALAGAGTFVLTGDNSGYTGNMSVTASGTGLTALRFATQSSVPNSGSVTINFPAAGVSGNATTLDLVNGINLPSGFGLNFTSLAAGGLRTQLTAAGAVSVNGPIMLSGDNTIQFTPGSGLLSLNGPISAGTGGYTGIFLLRGAGNGAVNNTINIPNGLVTKTDGGAWTINSTGNSWGNTGISVGTLNIGTTNALPIATTFTLGQADTNAVTFDLKGFNQTVGGLVQSLAASGLKQITNSAATPSVFTLDTAGTSTFGSAAIAIVSGNLQLVKNGTGTLVLGGTNTYTGGTLINNGTVKLGGNTSPFGPVAATVTVADGATVDANGQNVPAASRIATLTVQGSGVGGLGAIQNSGVGITNSNFWNNVVLTGDTTIGTATRYDFGNGGFQGGTFTLTKIGAGQTWWNPNAGATVGNIVVDGGIFGVQSSNNLGSTAFSLTADATGEIQTFSAITNNKPVILNGSQLASNNSTSTWTGLITLAGTGTANRLGTVTAGVGLVLNGQVTGNGFEKVGTGLLTLGSAANDYTGDTLVTAGTLNIAGSGRLSPNSALSMNGGTVDLVGTAQTIAGLKGAAGTVTSSSSAVLSDVQTVDTSYGGALGGAIALTKSGNGTLTLGGLSTTTGATTVNGGGLAVSGSLSGSAVTVSGGTLSGSGTTGPVTVSSGTLAPGGSFGPLNTGNLSLGGGTFATTITGPVGSSSVSVTGSAAITNNTALTLDFSAYDPLDNVDSFTLVANDGADPVSLAGHFTYSGNPLAEGAAFTAVSGANTQIFQITYAGGDGNDVVLQAVPEPGSALLLLGGFGALVTLQRSRRRA